MAKKKDELKPLPCPFCNDKAEEETVCDIASGFYVTCRNLRCYSRGPVRTTPRAAIKAWNRSWGSTPQLQELTRLMFVAKEKSG